MGMSPTQIAVLVEILAKRSATHKVPPLLIEGVMGVGKSQIIEQVGAKMGWKVINKRLANQEVGDLIGIPIHRAVDNTNKDSDHVTKWARPDWWPTSDEGTILFFDELNRAPIDVRNAIFEVLTEGRMHTHVLPKNCFIVAAINPQEGGLYQVEKLDRAMLNRFIYTQMIPNIQDLLTWARGNGKSDHVSQFLAAYNNLATQENLPNSVEIIPTPRGWFDLYGPSEDAIEAFQGDMRGVDKDELKWLVMNATLGNKVASQYKAFFDAGFVRPVTGLEIIEGYDKVKAKVKAQKQEHVYATVLDLVAEIGPEAKGITGKKGAAENIGKFILDLSAEWKVNMVIDLPADVVRRIGKVPGFTDEVLAVVTEAERLRRKK